MKALIIEPFYGGSHKQLVDLVCQLDSENCCVFTLPAKKWHWRARTAALYLSQVIPPCPSYAVLFCSSVLNLAELLALRPDLQSLKKIIYFHENQLVYPVRKQQHRDFQYGYNQIISSMVADIVLFNSKFNMQSFLENISSFLHTMPDFRPKGIAESIRTKCEVLYFPIEFIETAIQRPDSLLSVVGDNSYSANSTPNLETIEVSAIDDCKSSCSSEPLTEIEYTNCTVKQSLRAECDEDRTDCQGPERALDTMITVQTPSSIEVGVMKQQIKFGNDVNSSGSAVTLSEHCRPLHIIWPHRWEHDKDPETFLRVIYHLQDSGVDFRLSIIGQTYTDVSPEFLDAKSRLSNHIVHWGYLESRNAYYEALSAADVVVSTALHEFYGVAMLEAVHFGCYPLCPQRLVYPEIFPSECLYKTENQLVKRLKLMCKKPSVIRNKPFKMDLDKYSWNHLRSSYIRLLGFDIS